MATLQKGYTFGATETVTNAKLHALIDDATISGIVNADISEAAAISFSKLSEEAIDGSKLTGLGNIDSGAGTVPIANIPKSTDGTFAANSDSYVPTQKAVKTYADTKASKGANSDITSLSGLTTPLSRAQGGLASTAANNAASGPVFLDASSRLPAVDGSQLTGLSSLTQVNDSDTGTTFDNTEQTILSVAKTVTSGKTVFVIATGYVVSSSSGYAYNVILTLKYGSTTIQAVSTSLTNSDPGKRQAFVVSGIVTGLSGSTTFSVTGRNFEQTNTITGYGKLTVLEF